jgi:predicted DNA binding CopG/RHH family protein
MGRINIEIPENVHKKLKIRCITKGITIIGYINKLLEEELEK